MGTATPRPGRTGTISSARSLVRRLVGAVSLRVRLTVVLALGIAVVLTGGWLLLYRDLGGELSAVITSELEIRVADVIGAGDTVVPNDDVAAQVVDLDNRVVAPRGADPILTADELAEARRSPILVDRAVPAVAEHARVFARPDGDRVVVAAASTESVERARHRLLIALGIAGPAATMIIAAAGWVLTGAALRPVRRMIRRAETLSPSEPRARLPQPPGDDEIAHLGRTLNGMLDRIESTVARERAFIDDASHELRTPIAMLRAELELALLDLDDPEATRASLESALEEAQRLTRLTDSLLMLARADAGQLVRRIEPVDLRAVAAAVVARAPVRPGIGVDVVGGAVVVLADAPLLERIVANLLANALRHGRSRVRVETSRRGDEVHLVVADDGRGFPPALLDRAFDRFVRSGVRGANGGSRAGLGLAIVAAIAQGFGARVDAANGPPLGGGVVRVRFPAPASADAAGPVDRARAARGPSRGADAS